MTIGTELLQIGIGIPKAYGDPLSAEQGVTLLSLITNSFTGFSMSTNSPWQPSRPALKGGGVWAESALQDGRTLLSEAVGNVTETITLVATASDMKSLSSLIVTTQRFINQARRFTATSWQIEPVWIEWAALGGYGSQYALISNIEMSVSYVSILGTAEPQADVTLIIEREPAWRGIHPGASPRLWTKYWQGKKAGKDYDYTGIAFSDSSGLVEATVQNRTEFTSSTDDYDYPSTSKNWMEIPGEDIPGDAPALAAITVDVSQYTGGSDLEAIDMYIALSAKPHDLPQRGTSARTRQRIYTLNCVDGEVDGGLFAVVTDNTDGVKAAGSANIQAYQASGNETDDIVMPSITGGRRVSLGMQRGKYIAFLRWKYVSGTNSSLTATLTVNSSEGNVVLPSVVATNGATDTDMLYLGSLTLPPTNRAFLSPEGTGQLINSNDALASNVELTFRLNLISPSGVKNFIDLILVPIDESIVRYQQGDDVIASGFTTDINYITIDSTGYASRGLPETQPIVTGTQVTSGSELTGTDLLLTPGEDNYLIFMMNGNRTISGVARDNFPIKVDIVPRWYGVRNA